MGEQVGVDVLRQDEAVLEVVLFAFLIEFETSFNVKLIFC